MEKYSTSLNLTTNYILTTLVFYVVYGEKLEYIVILG